MTDTTAHQQLLQALRTTAAAAAETTATHQDLRAWYRAKRAAQRALGYRRGQRLAASVLAAAKRTAAWPTAREALGTDEEAWCADLDW